MHHHSSYSSRKSVSWLMVGGMLTFIFSVFLSAPQAHACRGGVVENTLFFDKIPPSLISAKADVIAQVVLLEVNNGYATAKVTQVVNASGVNIHQGDKVFLKYNFSSCGPNHKAGSKGMVIAKWAGMMAAILRFSHICSGSATEVLKYLV